MKQLKDIEDRTQLAFLLRTFYQKIKKDEALGPIFLSHIKDWDKHLERLEQFWESILFKKTNYKGSPLFVHLQLHQNQPLTADMFLRWLDLWEKTISEYFHGPKATLAKERAIRMAQVMLHHIHLQNKKR